MKLAKGFCDKWVTYCHGTARLIPVVLLVVRKQVPVQTATEIAPMLKPGGNGLALGVQGPSTALIACRSCRITASKRCARA